MGRKILKFAKNKMDSLPLTAKAAMAFMLATVLERAIQMITSPIFTRLMSTEQYGTVSLFNSYTEIIGLFALLSLSSGVFNNGMLEFKNDRDSYIASNLVLSNCATLVTLGIVILLRIIFKDTIIPFSGIYLSLMFVLFIVKPAYRFWLGRARYEYRYKSVVIVSVSLLLVSSVISVITTYYSDYNSKALGRLLGRDITYFLLYVYFYIVEVKGKPIRKKYIKYAFRYSVPLLPYYLSKYILNHFDQVMIASMVDKSSSGIYSVAYTIGFAIKFIWDAINSAITPWIYEKLNSKNYFVINKITSQGVFLYSGISVLACLFAPEIMKVLASADYYEGVYCIPPVVIGTYFVGITGWLTMVALYNKKTGTLSTISMILAVLNIVLNYIGIRMFGYLAAAYTTLICYMIQTIIMFIIAKKLAPGAFKGIITMFVSMVTIVVCIASMFLFDMFIIRLSISVFIMFLLLYIIKKIRSEKTDENI